MSDTIVPKIYWSIAGNICYLVLPENKWLINHGLVKIAHAEFYIRVQTNHCIF